MNIKGRIDKLVGQLFPNGRNAKIIHVRPEFGPSVEQQGATLVLRVDPQCADYPDEALDDEQREHITTDSVVTIWATPRINMPGSVPGRLVAHTMGRPRIKLPRRSYALRDGEPIEDNPPRKCFEPGDPDDLYFCGPLRIYDEDGNEIDV
jgi:hypothetical protein